MQRKNGKSVYLVALILFLGGLGYLVFSGLSQDSVYFLNVSEALAMDQAQLHQARLFGKVSAQNLQRHDGALGVSFDLIDKMHDDEALRVDYRGAVPDTFKEGVEVIVEGAFRDGDRTFVASSLITKCPSKYEKKSEEMEREKHQS